MQNKYWANEQWNNLASPSNIGAATSTHTHTKVDITDFAHKSSHAIGGSDPLTPADIGAPTSADAGNYYGAVTGGV